MESEPTQKGELVRWEDARGFGFIRPAAGGRDVFLHISVLPRTIRRPEVGDTVLYELEIQPDGKRRASRALLPHVPLAPRYDRRAETLFPIYAVAITAAIVMGIVGCLTRTPRDTTPTYEATHTSAVAEAEESYPAPPGRPIKGNVSIGTGRRLYHVPGMPEYNETIIDPARGERWFATEAEAQAAGWQRAPR